MGRRTSQRRSRRAKAYEAKRTKMRIRVPVSIASQQTAVTGPKSHHKFEESHGASLILPHPASKPWRKWKQRLIAAGPQNSDSISIPFLMSLQTSRSPLTVQAQSRNGSANNVKCLSSRHAPLLGTCRLLRKESLAYLLSTTQLALLNGVRPRVRHNPRQHGFPLWQLCNIQHVAIDISRKMQFEFFSRLKTLTLLWPNKAIAIQAPATWRSGLLLGYSME